jgi:hypothetical protein
VSDAHLTRLRELGSDLAEEPLDEPITDEDRRRVLFFGHLQAALDREWTRGRRVPKPRRQHRQDTTR